MGKKIFVIISLFISIFSVLLSSDLIDKKNTYCELDSLATTVGYQISISMGIDDDLKAILKKKYNITLNCELEDCKSVKVGDNYIYSLSKDIKPIFIFNSKKIKIIRSIVIGLYF